MDVAVLTPLLPMIPWDWSPVCLEDLKSCLVLCDTGNNRTHPRAYFKVKTNTCEGVEHRAGNPSIATTAVLRCLLSSCPQAL